LYYQQKLMELDKLNVQLRQTRERTGNAKYMLNQSKPQYHSVERKIHRTEAEYGERLICLLNPAEGLDRSTKDRRRPLKTVSLDLVIGFEQPFEVETQESVE